MPTHYAIYHCPDPENRSLTETHNINELILETQLEISAHVIDGDEVSRVFQDVDVT